MHPFGITERANPFLWINAAAEQGGDPQVEMQVELLSP